MTHPGPDDLADIALGDPVDAEVAIHVDSCADCADEVADLRTVARLAGSAARADVLTPPPPHVWEAIAADLDAPAAAPRDAGGSAPSAAAGPVRTARPSPRWLGLGLAAAIGLVLGGVVGVVATRSPAPDPAVLASATLDPLDGFATTGQAIVTEAAAGADRILEVDLRGLPATEGYFEVWLLTPDATEMVSLGAVGAGERSTLPVPAGLPLERFAVVDVSEESFDGDPTHSAVSVARGTLAT